MGNCKGCFKPKTSDDEPSSTTSPQPHGSKLDSGNTPHPVSRGKRSHGKPRASPGNQAAKPTGSERSKTSGATEKVHGGSTGVTGEDSSFRVISVKAVSVRSVRVSRSVSDVSTLSEQLLENLVSKVGYVRDLGRLCEIMWNADRRMKEPYSELPWAAERVQLNVDYKFSSAKAVCLTGNFFDQRPTFDKCRRLLNFYTGGYGMDRPRNDVNDFIDECLDRPVMTLLERIVKQRYSLDRIDVILYDIWFQKKRSAFNHIFAGSEQDDFGMHFWIQFNLQKEHLDFDPPNIDSQQPDFVIKLKNVDWRGFRKRTHTMFLGTSPEFEMALYTLLLLEMEERYEYERDKIFDMEFDGYPVQVKIVRNKKGPSW